MGDGAKATGLPAATRRDGTGHQVPMATAPILDSTQVFEQTSPSRRLVVLCGRGIHSRP